MHSGFHVEVMGQHYFLKEGTSFWESRVGTSEAVGWIKEQSVSCYMVYLGGVKEQGSQKDVMG